MGVGDTRTIRRLGRYVPREIADANEVRMLVAHAAATAAWLLCRQAIRALELEAGRRAMRAVDPLKMAG